MVLTCCSFKSRSLKTFLPACLTPRGTKSFLFFTSWQECVTAWHWPVTMFIILEFLQFVHFTVKEKPKESVVNLLSCLFLCLFHCEATGWSVVSFPSLFLAVPLCHWLINWMGEHSSSEQPQAVFWTNFMSCCSSHAACCANRFWPLVGVEVFACNKSERRCSSYVELQ